jgi:hypothetical protein
MLDDVVANGVDLDEKVDSEGAGILSSDKL